MNAGSPRASAVALRQLAAGLFAGWMAMGAALGQEAVPHTPHGCESDPAEQARRSFVLRLLGDVEFLVQNTDPPSSTWRLGQLDAFFSADLTDRLSLLTEVVVELDEHGESFIDLERLYVSYRANDAFGITLGRFHTGIGLYNITHHHGAYFETAVTRPQLFAFEDEGGALPVHEVGVSVDGEIPTRGLGLRYLFEMGNGQRWTAEDPRPAPSANDHNHNKSTNVGVSLAPDAWPGFRAGISYYRDLIAGPDDLSVASRVAAAYVSYRRSSVEATAEVVWMSHRFEHGGPFTNRGFYVHVGRRFGKVLAYGRYERIRIDPGTPLIGGLTSLAGPTLGARIDPAGSIAIKAQIERDEFAPTFRGRVQLAFVF